MKLLVGFNIRISQILTTPRASQVMACGQRRGGAGGRGGGPLGPMGLGTKDWPKNVCLAQNLISPPPQTISVRPVITSTPMRPGSILLRTCFN